MGVTLGARFVAYDPAGARRGILPYPLAATARDVFNDVGTGSIDYLADAQNSPLLEGLCEVAAEVNDGNGWVEVGARWMRLKRGASVIEETRTRRYTLHSYGMQLAKMRMLREETVDDNGDRIFAGATVGAIVQTLFDESKNRGNVTGFVYDFTATHDSAGQAWGSVLPPQTLRFGDDLLSLLRTLADNGACDWKVQGRTLRMFNPDTLGADKSATIRLFNGMDINEAPDDEDATEMAGRIGVVGDDGRTYEAISPSVNPWGLWEETVNAAGVKDIGGLQFIGEAEQRRRSAPRVQMTRKVRTVGARYLPVVDYNVGDTIIAPDQNGSPSAVRVRELQLDVNADGVSFNATLNDRILERDIRDRRTWQGMLGGAGGSAGGSGVPSNGDDKRAPAVPGGFVCTSVHLWSPTGEPFAVLDTAFAAVTTGTDGRALAVSKYELYGRRNIVGEVWRKITDSTVAGRITYSPMPVGEAWQFKLRALSSFGVPGEFTDPVSLTLSADETPPDRPSAPTATSRLGQIIVEWDGLTATGAPQPIDFAHGDVLMATSAAGAGVVVGEISPSGTFVAPEQPYNAQRWFSVVAVDSSGNRSVESGRVTVTTKPLVDTDVIGRVIDGANVKLASIQGDVLAAKAVDASKISDGVNNAIAQAQADATAAGSAADAAQASAGSAQSAADAAAGAAAAAAGIAEGKGKTIIQSATPAAADRLAQNLWIDTTGSANTPKRWTGTAWVAVTDKAATDAAAAAVAAQARADDAFGAAVAAATAAGTAQASADGKNRVWYQASAPAGTAHKVGDTWFDSSNGNRVNRWSGSAWAAAQLGTNAIANAAITNALIANATIESAKIANLDAGKITAGTLDAARIGAKSIAVEKLLVGNTTNLIVDPSAGFRIEDGWRSLAGSIGEATSDWRYATISGGPYAGKTGVRGAGTGSIRYLVSKPFQVSPGQKYLISVVCYQKDLIGASPTMSLRLSTKDLTFIAGTESVVMNQTSPSFYRYNQIVEIPAGNEIVNAELRYTISSAATGGYAYFLDAVVRPATTSELIVDGAVTADKVAANAITAAKINAGAVTAGKIAADAVGANEIIANSITASELAANSVTADELAANSVQAGHIQSNAVTAAKINAGAVTAVKVAANAITGEKIQANAIDGKTITGALIRSAAMGERTEMTGAGFRQVDAAGQELVKVGYGIPTGMQVRDPQSNTLVALADHVFGVKTGTAAPNWNLSKPSSTSTNANPVWSSWTYSNVWTPSFRTSTGRCLILAWGKVASFAVYQNYWIEMRLDVLRTDTNAVVATVGTTTPSMAQSPLNGLATGLPANVDLAVRFAARCFMYTNSGTPALNDRGFVALPA